MVQQKCSPKGMHPNDGLFSLGGRCAANSLLLHMLAPIELHQTLLFGTGPEVRVATPQDSFQRIALPQPLRRRMFNAREPRLENRPAMPRSPWPLTWTDRCTLRQQRCQTLPLTQSSVAKGTRVTGGRWSRYKPPKRQSRTPPRLFTPACGHETK